MIITEDSPLVKTPSDLGTKDCLVIDGLRYSASIADLCFMRLKNNLLQISLDVIDIKNPNVTASIFADSWAIIDASHRLRETAVLMNKIYFGNKNALIGKDIPDVFKETYTTIADFYHNTETTTLLRNYVHHSKNLWQHLISHKRPLWGTLHWYFTPTDNPGRCDSISLSAGISGGQLSITSPLSAKVIIRPIGPITLSAYRYTVCLSSIHHWIHLVINNIENQLRPQFSGRPIGSGDTMIKISMNNLHIIGN